MTVKLLVFKMRTKWSTIYFGIFSCTWIILHANGQLSDNSPPTLWLGDRNWRISDNEEIDTVITRVRGSDNEGDDLEYGLEPRNFFGNSKTEHLPFRIDNKTGVVYLNESLKGRGGERIYLYITVFDGSLTAKTEIMVDILNSTRLGSSTHRQSDLNHNRHLRPPSFLSLPAFNSNPPPAIANNPPPLVGYPSFQPKQQHYPSHRQVSTTGRPQTYSNATRLLMVNGNETKLRQVLTSPNLDQIIPPVQTDEVKGNSKNDTDPLNHQPVKSLPDLTVTLVPVVSVFGIFLVVGIIALVFRKKLCLGRAKSKKDDMRKESSGGIVLQEDPSFAMQQWRGPRAFSNRYEPWERESTHSQAATQTSAPPKTGDRWEFPRHRLKVFNILGEGAFGQVWKCEALDINGNEGISIVAVKTLKENATDRERADLVSELQVMKMLDPHPNVVRLLGCCTEKDPVFVIMEYVTKGKLQSYLRSSRAERNYNNMHGQSKTLTSRDLTLFAYQVARGMEFLSSNGIIHRDLAARNVLIMEDHTCKVADFGFARDVIASYIYERKSEGRLPIRWMAPESLYDNIFSVKSDVWSFGVLIWEIVTLGSTPYPGLSAAEVMKKVRDGHRLEKPEHCRRELYNIMYYCWDKDPKQRPSFSECVELLEKLLLTETDYIELERFPDHSYYNVMSLSGEKL